MFDTNRLTALSPLDGRYRPQLAVISELFSEFSLLKHRVKIEVSYLLWLSSEHILPALSTTQRQILDSLVSQFSLQDAQDIKQWEAQTMHDVKAVEFWLREKLIKQDSPLSAYVHLALTSEDTNNLSYSLMLQTARTEILIPTLHELVKQLTTLADEWADLPMMARTHGQPAVPTTLGKEIVNFAVRLVEELKILDTLPIQGKLTGAVGTFSAHVVAFPDQDWTTLSRKFVEHLGLTAAEYTTQSLPAESYARFFASLMRINLILLDLNQDLWRYISDGWLTQKLTTGQVGSSTMPQKINPIDFENSEGNLGLANALLQHFVQKLPVSRLQRDLSDSTVKRSFGSALGYCQLAYLSLDKGLTKVTANRQLMHQTLESHWEVLAEAAQVVLRAEGDSQGYEKLQQLTQGKTITSETVRAFIENSNLTTKNKHRLLALQPTTYIGLADRLTHQAVKEIHRYLQGGK